MRPSGQTGSDFYGTAIRRRLRGEADPAIRTPYEGTTAAIKAV